MDKQQLVAEFARLKHHTRHLPVFAWENRDFIAAALTEWAQQDDLRRHALDKAEDTCRARAVALRTRVDYHASPTLVARANEADECADAIAQLTEPHD